MKGKAVSIREGVYAWLVANGPATDKRMQEELGLDGNTQRPRRVELFRDGRIREMGKVKLPSGRSAMTWGAVPALRFERPGSGGP